MNDPTAASTDEALAGTAAPERHEPRQITPRPKTIADLSSTLASRPSPRRPAASAEAETSPSGPGPASDNPASGTSSSHPQDRTTTPVAKVRPRDVSGGGVPRGQQSSTPSRRPRLRDHTVFYVPVHVSEQVRETARRDDLTNADVIFDAIEATQDQLRPLLEAPVVPAGEERLFARAGRRPVGKKVQISAVISSSNLEAIDRLVADLGAESRSHLVEVALSAYFTADANATA